MKITAEHMITFELEGEPDAQIPPIDEPIYVYKEGDVITLKPMPESDGSEKMPEDFIVTEIEHVLYDMGMGEQNVIVYLRRADTKW